MNAATAGGSNYKYVTVPYDYYDYNSNYDGDGGDSFLTGIPQRNMYRNRNTVFRKKFYPPSYSSQLLMSRDDDYDRDSSYGNGCYEEGVSIGLLLTVALGVGLMGYVLYTKIVKNGGRRKKRGISMVDKLYGSYISFLPTIISLSGKCLDFTICTWVFMLPQ